MKKFIVFVLVIASVCLYCEARRFATQCDLVNELRKQGFPEENMSDWVCLIEEASRRATHKISPVRLNGSRDYGLFQINDNYWCSNTGVPGRRCNVTCVDLLADDITKAAACAKLIYERENFMAWYWWSNYCLGETLPDVSHCQ